jgi:hypothetical protein
MSLSPLTERCSEKFAKKLIGRTNMDDALKRLDKLTQEEFRMVVAQNLKATHIVDESVANMAVALDNRVSSVGDRVVGVDDRVARVDDKVASIDAMVASVDDRVVVIDDKVAEVLHGAQIHFQSSLRIVFINLNRSDGKETKQVMKQTANDIKRSSSPGILLPRPTVYCRWPAATGRSTLALSP